MSTRALLIGEEQRAAIAALRARAQENIYDPATVQEIASRDINAFRASMLLQSIELPRGFVVTYTHERQPIGVVHHISVSVEDPTKTPHPAAMEMILAEFGMHKLEHSLKVWLEDIGAGHKAVNVVQWLWPPVPS